MKKKINFFLIAFFLGASFFFFEKTLAEENHFNQESFKPRSVPLEIKEGDDPFKSYFGKRLEVNTGVKKPAVYREEIIHPPSFKVQGIIWGGDLAQAIVDNQVLKVGDNINGAKIVNIEKGSLTISFSGEIFKIESPSRPEESESKDKLLGGEKNEK